MATKKTKKTAAKKGSRKRAAKKPAAKRARAKGAGSGNLNLTFAAPSLTVNDIHASMAWYRDVLGFEVGERWEDKGTLRGVEMTAGVVTFMISQDDWKKGRDRVKGEGVRIYCATKQNIDRIAERIKAAGGSLSQEPRDQPWGTRDLAVNDPDGYKLTIASEWKQ